MKLKFDLEKMSEIYGDEIKEIILENMDIIEKNAETLKKFKFNDIEGLFERCPAFFFNFPNKFTEKIEKLKKELGENYAEEIENDVNLIEES